MAQFPHASVPDSLQQDDQAAAFLEDVRLVVSAMQLIGTGLSVIAGRGTPEGTTTARGGSLYLRADGPPWLYQKETAALTNTGWVVK